MSVCLFICLYPINVKTAKPIGPKFLVGPRVTPGKKEFSKICQTPQTDLIVRSLSQQAVTFDQIKIFLNFSVGVLNGKYNCISLKITELQKTQINSNWRNRTLSLVSPGQMNYQVQYVATEKWTYLHDVRSVKKIKKKEIFLTLVDMSSTIK